MGVKDMFFGPAPKYIKKMEPTTPFDAAKQEVDNRDGAAGVQSYNWRRIAVGLLLINFLQTGGLIFQSTKSTVAPYVIEVDSTTGMARNVGMVQSQEYKPNEMVIKYFLNEFVKNTRELPLDPVVFNGNWNKAYAYMTKGAAGKMTTILQADPPGQMLGKKTVQTNILSILLVAGSSNSYQARWTEEDFVIGSGQKVVTTMTGTFTVHMSPPKDEKELMVNPLGIYVSDFNWSKEAAVAK